MFGCIAYAHKPTKNRKEILMKEKKNYILIGYSDESKAYRLFDPNTYNLHINKDVIFDEAAT